jgi:hypothetical protein
VRQDIAEIIRRARRRFPNIVFGYQPRVTTGQVPTWTFASQSGSPAIWQVSRFKYARQDLNLRPSV